jgi:hypothetical protein
LSDFAIFLGESGCESPDLWFLFGFYPADPVPVTVAAVFGFAGLMGWHFDA